MAAQTGFSRRLGTTARRDRWWPAPVLTAAGLTAFGIYSVVVAAMGADYVYTAGGAHYLSPLPDLESWGLDLPFTYAFRDLGASGFRLTCYCYRKAYSGVLRVSAACTVTGQAAGAIAEGVAPVCLAQLQRAFFYLVTMVVGILSDDAVQGFFSGARTARCASASVSDAGDGRERGLFARFTFGCNSLRHLVGGRLAVTALFAARKRHRLWSRMSLLNADHGVGLGKSWRGRRDRLYRLASAGVFHDPRII